MKSTLPCVAERPVEIREHATLSGQPGRAWFGNRFVYLLISQRARGLSIGINLNPNKACNFDCVYCEVDRSHTRHGAEVDVPAMATELENLLAVLRNEGVRSLPGWEQTPDELSALKEVALSGDGEPTLCPDFAEVLEAVLHARARGPFFKIVLITNGTGLHRQQVCDALRLLTRQDEIWVKLDVGTQADLERINRPVCPAGDAPPCLQLILENIIRLGRERPVVIQSLFPSINGQGPSEDSVAAYISRLEQLKRDGAQISLVQVYSVHRPAVREDCRHLSLRELSAIARRIRTIGLKAEVF